MLWQRLPQPAGRHFSGYLGETRCEAEGESCVDAVREALALITEAVIRGEGGQARDCIKVELWLDSGRIILYPARAKSPDRDETVAYQISIPEMLEEWERVATSDENDALFESAITSLSEKALRCIRLAVTNFQPLLLPVKVYDADDTESSIAQF